MNNKLHNFLWFFLIFILSFPILFLKIESFSFRLWDESMFAINSLEMLNQGSWLVPIYQGVSDIWNSKPPMTNWLQMISIKMFGFNELAIRLPSAIASFITILFTFYFTKKYFNNLVALMSSLILLTSFGFVGFHTSRTGDSDAITTLFLTISSFIFLNIIFKKQYSGYKVLLFFLAISLAFLSKSIVAFLFFPAFISILFFEGKFVWKKIFSSGYFYIGMIFLLGIILSFIFLRDSFQNGYFSYFINNDILRTVNEIENHKEPFLFYIQNLFLYRYEFWFVLSTIAIGLSLFRFKNDVKMKLVFYISLIILFYLVIISASVTKLEWYDMPLFPFLSIIAAVVIDELINKVSEFKYKIAFIVLIFIFPYRIAFGKSQSNSFNNYEQKNEATEIFLYRSYLENKNLNNYTVYHSGYPRAIECYIHKFNAVKQNINLTFVPDFQMGERVIVSRDSLKQILQDKYDYEVEFDEKNVTIYNIKGNVRD